MLHHRQTSVKQGNPTLEQALAWLPQAAQREQLAVHVAQNEVVMEYRLKTTNMHGDTAPHPSRLLDEVRRVLRTRHYSLRTEHVCVGWIRRFILANGRRHPHGMGVAEVQQFLSRLAK